jgi:ankyrin repeat protein
VFKTIETNNFQLLRFLINDVKLNLKKLTDKEGRTIMHVAAQHGNDLMIYMLGELGADINAPGPGGNTPLHIAVLNNRV